jgi:ABC-type transport system, involved in lipoprotein release, permease component
MANPFRYFNNTLRHYPVPSTINIIGLAAAIATLYIILVQFTYDKSFNKGIKDSDRTFAIEFTGFTDDGQYTTYLSRPFGEKIIADIPEIEAGGECGLGGEGMVPFSTDSTGKEAAIYLKSGSMSTAALKVFGFEAESGSFDDFSMPNTVILSKEGAKKLKIKPGDQIFCNGQRGTVAAIFKDFPKNSDWNRVEIISNIGKQSLDDGQEWSYPYYVKLYHKDDAGKVAAAAMKILMGLRDPDESESDSASVTEALKRYKFRLVPLTETYFEKNITPGVAHGNATSTTTLLAIAILVMLIAFINFFNFFFSLVPARIKAVNTYKILGSTRSSLIRRFVLEAVCFVAIAVLLALGVIFEFGRSNLANYISTDVGIGSHPWIALATLGFALIVALAASISPARYITSFSPAFALKNGFASTPQGKTLRYVLVGLQFVISMALIIGVQTMQRQYKFLNSKNLGFNRDNLVAVKLNSSKIGDTRSLNEALKQGPMIKDLTWAACSIVQVQRMGWGREIKGKQQNWQCYVVTPDFLKFFDIPIVEGRDFTEDDASKDNGTFIFNETAKSQFDLTLEDKVSGHRNEPTEIAGFCKDFNFKPLQYAGGPMSLYVFGATPWWDLTCIYIRTVPGAKIKDMTDYVKKCISEQKPDIDVSRVTVRSFGDELAAQYTSEKKLITLIEIFTIISILLSLMGVFSQVMFETQYRKKEIGIRRVHGASIGEILGMFVKRYLTIVSICFAIAAPIAYYAVTRWLQSFAYQISPSWLTFALSYILVLTVTLAIVVLRSLSAATDNPVNSIKTE